MKHSFFIIFILLLISCENTSAPGRYIWHEIKGRNQKNSLKRPLLYRALTPLLWTRKDPQPDDSLEDTTRSISEFTIEGNIRVTIHTFPFQHHEMRIPPQAQIARWKKQFEKLDPIDFQVQSESHGGFSGLFFEGKGTFQGVPDRTVLGWSMQLASHYDLILSLEKNPQDHFKRADFTIKIVGPSDLVEAHYQDLIQFGKSFELIDELPTL